MTILRIRFKQLGGHVHCRVFTATMFDGTFAKVGDLTFDEREWPLIQLLDGWRTECPDGPLIVQLKHEDEA